MMTFEPIIWGDRSIDRILEIYMDAFPQEERRELSSIEWLLANEKCYHLIAIQNEEAVVGMTAYWDFGETVYIEYLAMDANLRGGGLGSKALTKMIDEVGDRKVIFEVELPTNDIASRRIDFYKRFNFKLWENIPYNQPPYRKSDDWLPMLLMTNGEMPTQSDIALLHQRVYNVDIE